MTRLVGIQIANGFSPEARVFATLLRHVGVDDLRARVLCQTGPDGGTAARFAEELRTSPGTAVCAVDFGWRSMVPGRGASDRVRARLRFISALPRALALAREAAPDAIYSCQQVWDCWAATYIARRLRRPQIIHLHYIVGPWLHRPVLARLRQCAHVITVSDFIREEALRHGVAPDRVTTIRNSIALPPPARAEERSAVHQELGLPDGARVVGIVARLDPNKGQADSITAFSRIAAAHPTAHLLVIGSESPWHPGYGDELTTLAAECAHRDRIRFLGRRADISRLLNAMDVFIHPSRRDPCPLALLEASAAGLPVLAYADGGASEIVQDGVTGLLAAPGDVDGLSARLDSLLADPNRARAIGSAGRACMTADFQPTVAGTSFAHLLARAPWLESLRTPRPKVAAL